MNSLKIIIAGAGFGGIRVALDLARTTPGAQITLINDTSTHCFHPDLYEVATAILPNKKKITFQNLSGTVNIPLHKIFSGKKVNCLEDKVREIDTQEQYLVTEKSGNLPYDFLVLCLGSTSGYFGVDGAEKFSHPLKNTNDALNIRNDLEELICQSEKKLTVVIAGGGFTGVELAGELVGFLGKMTKVYGREKAEVIILEGLPDVLSGMPRWARELALKRLQKLGINVLAKHLINKIDNQNIYCQNKQVINYDYLIWTAGIKGADCRIKGVELSKRNQLEVNSDLTLKNYPNVLVVGDLAECMDPKRDCPVPQTARAAIGQGKMAAKNIQLMINGQKTIAYVPDDPVFVVPIGGKFALSNIFGLKISGLPGWGLKRLVTLKYLLSILPFWQALTIWWKGVKIYLGNDG